MPIRTVAILSPGDMGHAVGCVLGEHGFDVITSLQARSERTRKLADQGRIRDVSPLREMVLQADLVLSILVPGEAVKVAQQVADVLQVIGTSVLFADCNAVSPETSRMMDTIFTSAGGRYVDGSIIGPPPGSGRPPRFYMSGPNAGIMSELDGKGIDVRLLGDMIGRASGIKMCYAALTKGTSALWVALLVVAEALGLSGELREELLLSQEETCKRMEAEIPVLPTKALRWVGEMEEIAATFDSIGVTPYFHRGAAELYRIMSTLPFALERAENADSSRTMAQTISAMAQCILYGGKNKDSTG